MRKISVVLLCAAAIPVTALTGTAHAEEAPDCRDVVIGVGGNGQRYAESKGARTIITDILADKDAEGYRTENVDYTSSVWPTGPYTKDYSVEEGRAELDREIAEYRAECPNGEVTVIGHSLGAEVVETPDAEHTILLGDPRDQQGIYNALPGVFPGASNPGSRDAEAEGAVSVCREFDGICDTAAPWSDPAKFVQGTAGYLMGWHGYSPEEVDQYQGAAPGEYLIDAPKPIEWLPESTPTGIPAAPELSLPEIAPPVPLPSAQDFYPLEQLGQPYTPTPLEEYIPEWVEPVLPQEVLNYVPPAPEQVFVLPPAPEFHIPGLF
jgi:hypothetical protein